jgi:hypothetical protein
VAAARPVLAVLPVLAGLLVLDDWVVLDRHGPVGKPGGGALDRQRIRGGLALVGLVLVVRQRHQVPLLHVGQEYTRLG